MFSAVSLNREVCVLTTEVKELSKWLLCRYHKGLVGKDGIIFPNTIFVGVIDFSPLLPVSVNFPGNFGEIVTALYDICVGNGWLRWNCGRLCWDLGSRCCHFGS